MTIESAIRLVAGSLILISLALYQFVSPWGLLLAAFVGQNLAQSAMCPITSNPYLATLYGAAMGYLVSGGLR